MATPKIGCGQITWRDKSLSPDDILAEIAKAGYAGAPAGAPNLEAVPEAIERFHRHGLEPAPGYAGAEFWDAGQRQAIVESIGCQAEIAQAFGLTDIYVAANLTKERRAVSGHVSEDDSMTPEQFDTFADTLRASAEAASGFGVTLCFHNHVGSYIETRREIDELFSRLDGSGVYHGPDTGHLAWAGDEVVPYVQAYARSIRTMHVKDIDPGVRARGRAEKLDYMAQAEAGIFTELGQGLVDIPGVLSTLDAIGFDGWLIVETDVTQLPTAYESARVSRDYLRSLGI
jgi:inosose dehydratase